MRRPLFAAISAILLTMCLASVAQAEKPKYVATLGPGNGFPLAYSLALGRGSATLDNGIAHSGTQVLFRAELGAYLKSSPIGNLAGIEGGFEMGWDGVPKRHRPALADYMGGLNLAADAWLAFPVTLVNLGDGSNDWLRLNIAPGLGISLRGAYFSVKSALAVEIPGVGPSELAATWWPDAANYAFGNTSDSLNAAQLKLSYFMSRKYQLFLQFRQSHRVAELPPATDNANVFGGLTKPPGMDREPFAQEKRYDYETVWSVGIGAMPF